MAETNSSAAAGQTRQKLLLTRVFGSQAAAALSGMAQGWRESLNRPADDLDAIE